MPLADLYHLLVPHLSPASYLSALRADPLFWRRYKRGGTVSVALVVRAHIQRVLLHHHCITPQLVEHLMRGFDSGELYLMGGALLAMLNGDAPYSNEMDIAYVAETYNVRDAISDDDDDEDQPPPAPRKRSAKESTVWRIIHADDSVNMGSHTIMTDDRYASDFVAHTRATVSGGLLSFHFAAYETREKLERLLPLADFAFCGNAWSAGKLVIRNLAAVIARRCVVSLDTYAQHIYVCENNVLTSACNEAKTRILKYRARGYEVQIGQQTAPPAFATRLLDPSPKLRKELLGSIHPPRCIYSSDCTCYENRFGTLYARCMSKHDCTCNEHVAWLAKAENMLQAKLRAEMEDQWQESWTQFEVEPLSVLPGHAIAHSAAKRLKFE